MEVTVEVHRNDPETNEHKFILPFAEEYLPPISPSEEKRRLGMG